MSRRKKNAQHEAQGCKICGDRSVGRGIEKHVGGHKVAYDHYKKCFNGTGKVIVDELVETGTAGSGMKRVVTHVLVRRFTLPIKK